MLPFLPRQAAARAPAVLSRLLLLTLGLAACSSPLPYVPRDPGLAQARLEFQARDLQDPALGQFLASAGQRLPEPGQPWQFDTLALVAGWFSSEVRTAQSHWQAALQRQALGAPVLPAALDSMVEHHSLSDASRPQPWTLGLGFEFTLPSAQRRAARQSQLDAAVQLARIGLAQAFWDARLQVRTPWLQLLAAQAQWPLAQRQQALGMERVQRLQARMRAGEVATAELVSAEQAAGQADLTLARLERQRRAAQLALHAALGLPPEAGDLLVAAPPPDPVAEDGDAMAVALENRLDLRAAEARFEVADADLRWEVAQQFPELALRPGYEWDQGDHRLRIGLALPLQLPAAHRAQVTQAEAEREARVRELQGQQVAVLQQVAAARLALRDATAERDDGQVRVQRAEQLLRAVEAGWHAGERDPLAVLEAQVALLDQRSLQVQADQELWRRRAEFEDLLQQPLAALAARAGAAAGAGGTAGLDAPGGASGRGRIQGGAATAVAEPAP